MEAENQTTLHTTKIGPFSAGDEQTVSVAGFATVDIYSGTELKAMVSCCETDLIFSITTSATVS